MKNFFAVCIIPLVVTWSATASAKEGIYITGKAGTSVVNVYGINSTFSQDEIVNGHATLPDRTKGVFGGGVAIGYDFYDPFQLPVRLEPIPLSEVRRMLKAGRILLHLVIQYT